MVVKTTDDNNQISYSLQLFLSSLLMKEWWSFLGGIGKPMSLGRCVWLQQDNNDFALTPFEAPM